MERARLGQILMALGAILLLAGVVSLATGGSDDSSATAASTTTSAPTISSTSTSTTAAVTTTSTTSVPPTTTAVTTTSTTAAVTTTAAPSTTVAPESAETFLSELNVAFEAADAEFLLGRLNQATIERYGSGQCATYLAGILPQSQGLSMRREVGDGPWGYTTDNVTTSLTGVSAIEVDRVVNGETRINELHWQLVDGVFTWFTDCGSPLIID